MPKIIVNNPKNVIEAHLKTNYFKLKNTGGPKGDQGPKGDTGEIAVGSTTTGAPGSNASVTNSGTSTDAILNFTIPRGDKGDKGDTGAAGQAATITVGSTTTGNPGTNASVTNSGTSSAAVLNFTIPKGAKGDTGATGTAATVTVGTTTTGAAGTSASVTNSGTSSAAVLNFTIPKGDTGATGATGATGSVKSTVVASLPSTGNTDTFYLVDRTATTGSGSGSSISFTNPEPDGDITSLQLNGNTTQTTYTGKNLIKVSDTSVTNASVNYYVQITPAVNTTLVAGKTYTFSADITIGGSVDRAAWSIGCGTNQYITDLYQPVVTVPGPSAHISGTFTPTDAKIAYGTNLYIRFPRFSGPETGVNYSIKNVMLEESASETPYEPYVGATPSPNPSYPQEVKTVTGEQTVTVNGQNYEVELGNKNLINESELDARVTSNSFSDWYYYNANLKAKVTAGQTYTLSMKVDAVSVTPYELSVGVGASSYAADVDTKADIETVGDRIFITFTPTQAQINSAGGNTLFMRCPRYRTLENVSYTISEIKLEEGDKMTAYSSYMQAPVELCKIGTYQDYIWNDDGTWKIHKETNKIVYDGSNDETWGVANSGTANWLYYTYVTNGADTPNTQMSNMGTYTTITGSNTNQGIQLVSGNLLRVRLGSEQTTSAWRTFLGTDAMLVYYGLTTATDTAITDANLIAQLDALLDAPLLSGVNNIILTPNANAQGTLDITYSLYDELNQHKVYIWSSSDQTWQVIVP